jgi:hypothetical protein
VGAKVVGASVGKVVLSTRVGGAVVVAIVVAVDVVLGIFVVVGATAVVGAGVSTMVMAEVDVSSKKSKLNLFEGKSEFDMS